MNTWRRVSAVIGAVIALIPISCTYGQKTEQEYHDMLSGMYKNTVPLIKSAELVGNEKEFLILDTREKSEFIVSHLPTAQHVGFNKFSESSLDSVDKNMPIVVYCSVGYRSERIGEKLLKLGFTNVQNLYGSIFDWANLGLPLIDSSGQVTNRVHCYNKKWGQWLVKGEKVY